MTELGQRSERESMPPLGVMPEYIWKEQRAADLARAVNEHIERGFIKGDYQKLIDTWLEELRWLWDSMEHLKQREPPADLK